MNRAPPKDKSASFDISIWRRATISDRQVRERQRLQLLDEVWKALERLRRTYQWDDLYVFGSVTKSEHFGDHSDIDIGIHGLDKLLHYRFIADLSGLLDKKVDVVRLEDCPFEDAIRMRGIRWKKEK